MSDEYDKVSWRGFTFDKQTVQAIEEMEARLGRTLRIMQGSYHSGVQQSGGTHDGGGAVDFAPDGPDQIVEVGREVGFAIWHRQPWQGDWAEHCHGILHGNAMATAAAKAQIFSPSIGYNYGKNGLANGASDDGPRNPKTVPLPVYHYTTIEKWPAWTSYPGWARIGYGRGLLSNGNLFVQCSLAARGYANGFDSGKCTRRWTPEASGILHNFQIHHGLKSAGPNAPSWDKLGAVPTNVPNYPGTGMFTEGKTSVASLMLQSALICKGFGSTLAWQATTLWRPRATTAVKMFQESQAALKGDADGIPGPMTWKLAFS